LATLRIAELGFLGVRVITWMHTPRLKGDVSKAGDLDLCFSFLRPLRTSWFIVGISVLDPAGTRLRGPKRNEKYSRRKAHCNNYFPAQDAPSTRGRRIRRVPPVLRMCPLMPGVASDHLRQAQKLRTGGGVALVRPCRPLFQPPFAELR